MIEDRIADIIGEAERNNTSLLNYYYELIKKNNQEIAKQLFKAIAFLESEIEEKKHNKRLDLKDINVEWGTDYDVEAEMNTLEFSVKLKEFNPDKIKWHHVFPLSEKRIKKHKKAIESALKYQKEEDPQQEEYDATHFNEVGYKLYNYLVKKYDKGADIKVHYSNIWRFMRTRHKKSNGDIIFKFTQKEFNKFNPLGNLKYQITGHKYVEVEVPTLQDLTSKFSKKMN
jgi:hypothetical protein